MLNEFEETRRHTFDVDGDAPQVRGTFTRALGRSWMWVSFAVLLGAVAGIAVGLAQPNLYSSTTKLILRTGAREQITAESAAGLEGEQVTSPLTMVDEMQMLTDVAILERVAVEVGPNEILEPADPARDDGPQTFPLVRLMHRLQADCQHWWARRRGTLNDDEQGEPLEAATKTLLARTSITNEPGSNVIVITYTSTSPESARTVAQAIADAFIERHRAQFSIQSVVETSRIKLERAKETRDTAANAYVEFMNQSSEVELDPQTPALQTEITAIESELFAARVRKKGIAKQRATLTGRLEDVPVEVEVTGPVVMVPNEEYETQLLLKRNLLTQKQNLALENRSIDERRRIERNLDQQISQADQKLNQLPKVVAQDPGLRENTAHTTLSTRVEDLDLEDQGLDVKIDSLEQRLADKQSQASAQRRQVLVATLRRKDLDSTREAADAYYKQMLARYSVLEALGNIEKHDDPNLRVLQAATFDRGKVAPKRFSLLLKGTLGGLLAGIAFAALRQRFERRLEPKVFERDGLPMLGVVPEVPALRHLRVRG